jgi:hypothetical protein
MNLTEADPKGLVRESYRIDGISAGECRSIFVDWALSVPAGLSVPDAACALIAAYGQGVPEHPMTAVLAEALTLPDQPRRRGGRAARQGISG